MGKSVEDQSQEIASNVPEWRDSTGWTEEILQCIMAVITVWEEKYGLSAGNPRNVTEFRQRKEEFGRKQHQREVNESN